MRSRSWFLASLMTFSLAALAGACASPLDEPVDSLNGALRTVHDPELADLPGCDGFGGRDVAGGEVLPTDHPDLYAVSVGGQLLCVDDGAGVNQLERRGVGAEEFTPLEGTPLPARTGDTTSGGPDDDGPVVASGTPLPANH